MNILLIEPFFTGSHKSWGEGLKKYTKHNMKILSLKGRYWKWRMHGGAITLAKMFNESDFNPDLIIVTDMLDLTTFKSLTMKKSSNIPFILYFHENQLTYPWSPDDPDIKMKRDLHYGFINYTSALAADKICFNSEFHLKEFYAALKKLLKAFPDHNELESLKFLKSKSRILHLGLDLSKFDKFRGDENKTAPVILWNHRWEYDKNPSDFFNALYNIQEKGLNFRVVILGESYKKIPKEFLEAKEKLKDKIIQFGYCKNFEEYSIWLHKSDLLPVTSNQDFFGISAVEAIYCNCHPILPDRLAFGEHIPSDNKENFFYTDLADLSNKIENYIGNFEYIKNTPLDYSSFVDRYSWEQMIEFYDEEFESVVESSRKNNL
jgi:glycosyltransferase involved in cell wall biosynthesis